MKISFALFIIALAGCSKPAAVAVPVSVKIPIAISCEASIPAEPNWNIAELAPDADATDKLKAVLADLALSKGYSEELRAELEACL